MRWLAVILSVLICLPLASMEGRFVSYGSADGLPSGRVYAIAQDADGFLWLGTRNGLCRFDGAGFKVWKGPGRVNALAVDRNNRLWLGTTGGIRIKDGDEFIEGPAGNIRALKMDSDGFVWATVGDTLLLKLSFNRGLLNPSA